MYSLKLWVQANHNSQFSTLNFQFSTEKLSILNSQLSTKNNSQLSILNFQLKIICSSSIRVLSLLGRLP